MKILVTGHLGVIGRDVFAYLQSRGYDCHGYDLKDGNDILKFDRLAGACADKDVVVHLAAIPRPDPAVTFENYFNVNIQGTHNVCRAIALSQIRPKLVFMSSQARYGLYDDHGEGYGLSKRIGEDIIAWYAGQGGPTQELMAVILRLTGYGGTVFKQTTCNAVELGLRIPTTTGFLVLNVTDTEDKTPYKGRADAELIELLWRKYCQ